VRCLIYTWMRSVLVQVSTESSLANVGLSSAIKHMQRELVNALIPCKKEVENLFWQFNQNNLYFISIYRRLHGVFDQTTRINP
jgi:hypothetical protein